MQYYSTNHQTRLVSFREAMLQSEAADGGLYMPERLPLIPSAFIKNIAEMSISDISYVLTNILFDGDLPSADLKRISDEATTFPIPLKEIEPDIYVLELFHGATKTVKDIGSQFMTRIFRALHPDCSCPLNVMVATTGNSGNAIANSFHRIDGVNVFVLYPTGLPTPQLSHVHTLGDNVHAIEVRGDIEDCRDIIAGVFNDSEMNRNLRITSANSFNICALLPYTILYFHAYSQLRKKIGNPGDVVISVPCGNCGNVLAGYMSQLMGLPVTRIIGACNANGAFHNFLNGIPVTGRVQKTLAYAMDTKATANHSRFLELCDGDISRLRQKLSSDICSDTEISRTVNDVLDRTGYLLGPHTAVAYNALRKQLAPGEKGIIFATAHPSRSASIIEEITGDTLELPADVRRYNKNRKKPEAVIAPTLPALKKYLKHSGHADDIGFRV